MRRREFIRLLCGLSVSLPHVASAQQFEQKKRVAFLTGFSRKDSNTRVFVAAVRTEEDSLRQQIFAKVKILAPLLPSHPGRLSAETLPRGR
jgi:hypothetical protein